MRCTLRIASFACPTFAVWLSPLKGLLNRMDFEWASPLFAVLPQEALKGRPASGESQSHSLILQSKDGGILIPKQNSAWQQEQHCSFHSALGISYP